MNIHSKKLFRSLLFIIIASSSLFLDARKFDLHISIPISCEENSEIYKALITIQDQIVKAAADNGYCFNISMMHSLGFHITLETIQKIDERDLKKFNLCIEAIQKTLQSFDLTQAFRKAQFELKGSNSNPWGVLSIGKNADLEALARTLRNCFKKQGLTFGRFEKIEPHISLGKFFKYENESLPKNLYWVPDFNIRLSKEGFMVKNLVLTKNEEKSVQTKKESSEILIFPRESYDLSSKPKKLKSSPSNKQLEE